VQTYEFINELRSFIEGQNNVSSLWMNKIVMQTLISSYPIL